jgi:hypothetical protein
MRHFLIIPLALFFKLSFSQNDSFSLLKNKIDAGTTFNVVSNLGGLSINGWNDGNIHASIFSLAYKRYLTPKWNICASYSYVWKSKQSIDYSVFPQQIGMIGRNLTLGVGYKQNLETIPRISLTPTFLIGLQDVAEKNLINNNPDFRHNYYETEGDRGLLTGFGLHVEYRIIKHLSINLNGSIYRRELFKSLDKYYKSSNRSYQRYFTLIQPSIGIHF